MADENNTIDYNDEATREAYYKDRHDKEVTGLTSNRDDILKERNDLEAKYRQGKELLNGFGGVEGLAKLSELQKKLSTDERTKALADGKFDEILKSEVDKIESDYANKAEASTAKINELENTVSGLRQADAFNKMSAEVDRLAVKLGMRDHARADAKLLVKADFVKNDQGVFIHTPNGKVTIGPDGHTPMTLETFLSSESIRENKPHWFKDNVSGGSTGSGTNTGSFTGDDLSKATNQSEFDAIRAKQLANQKTRYV